MGETPNAPQFNPNQPNPGDAPTEWDSLTKYNEETAEDPENQDASAKTEAATVVETEAETGTKTEAEPEAYQIDAVHNLPNENSTDRDHFDGISPDADASTNPFEVNPDDSVDITGEYNDTEAQALETEMRQLEGLEDAEMRQAAEVAEAETTEAEAVEATGNTEAENLTEKLAPFLEDDGPETHELSAETLVSREDYEQFINQRLNRLISALESPEVNATPEDEQIISTDIELTAKLMDVTEKLDRTEESNARETFEAIKDDYLALAEEAAAHDHPHNAETDRRLASRVNQIASEFNDYIVEQRAIAKNRAAEAEYQATHVPSPDDLPDNAIR